MRRWIFAVLLLFCASATSVSAAEYKLFETDLSQPKLIVEYRVKEMSGGPQFQIWVEPRDHSTSKTLLIGDMMYPNKVLVSPDGNRLALNDKWNSSSGTLNIYIKTTAGKYEYDKTIEKKKNIGVFFAKVSGFPAIPEFHHHFETCVAWSADSSAILIKLHGAWEASKGIPKGATDDWYCVYDFNIQEFTLDLGRLNKAAIHVRNQETTKKQIRSQGRFRAFPTKTSV